MTQLCFASNFKFSCDSQHSKSRHLHTLISSWNHLKLRWAGLYLNWGSNRDMGEMGWYVRVFSWYYYTKLSIVNRLIYFRFVICMQKTPQSHFNTNILSVDFKSTPPIVRTIMLDNCVYKMLSLRQPSFISHRDVLRHWYVSSKIIRCDRHIPRFKGKKLTIWWKRLDLRINYCLLLNRSSFWLHLRRMLWVCEEESFKDLHLILMVMVIMHHINLTLYF